MDRTAERKREIVDAVADVRAIEARQAISRDSLGSIKDRLMKLATRQDLFSSADFPPPVRDGKINSCL